MAQVLYRKYRSKNLSEIVGQQHITKTLSEAIKSGRISHAYLLTGPRGVGKTSVARILAHEINGLAYDDDKPHIDIIEIDAASNRRIDEIRDLRDKVHITPSSAKYKVYIIDEVHMLTKEAFNALLKTLEEPPAHVIFILATTDPHKLPDTIISRTQHYSFKPIDSASAVDHLKSIAKQEKIKVSSGALELIAEHGEGSFRDSISLLDQLSSSANEITEADVRQMLGIPSKEAIDSLVALIDSDSTSYKQMATSLKELEEQGFSPSLLAKRLMNDLRDKLINDKLNMSHAKAIKLLKELLGVDAAQDPNSFLLLTLLSGLDNQAEATVEAQPAPPTLKQTVEAEAKVETKAPKTQPKTVKSEVNEDIWPEVLNELKNSYNTLYGIVRMAQPVFKEGNQLDLMFDFAFHQKQVSEAKNKKLISGVIYELTGQEYKIEGYLNEKPSKAKSDDLDNISKIFGGGEVVD